MQIIIMADFLFQYFYFNSRKVIIWVNISESNNLNETKWFHNWVATVIKVYIANLVCSHEDLFVSDSAIFWWITSQIIFMIYGVSAIEIISGIDLSVSNLFYHYFALNQWRPFLRALCLAQLITSLRLNIFFDLKDSYILFVSTLLPPIHSYLFSCIKSDHLCSCRS